MMVAAAKVAEYFPPFQKDVHYSNNWNLRRVLWVQSAQNVPEYLPPQSRANNRTKPHRWN